MKARSLLILAGLLIALPLAARDDIRTFDIADVFEHPEFSERLNEVQFFFKGADTPEVERTLGTFQSNKKTNAFGKSDEEACRWVFLTALLSLQERAVREGGDAVIDVYSYYKKRTFESPDQYQCGAGNIMAGVTLKGTVAKLK